MPPPSHFLYWLGGSSSLPGHDFWSPPHPDCPPLHTVPLHVVFSMDRFPAWLCSGQCAPAATNVEPPHGLASCALHSFRRWPMYHSTTDLYHNYNCPGNGSKVPRGRSVFFRFAQIVLSASGGSLQTYHLQDVFRLACIGLKCGFAVYIL